MSRYDHATATTSLYVKNIPDHTVSDDLRDLFSKYGSLGDVYIPLDYYTRRPRGFAYVQFEDPRDAEEAVDSVDGKRLNGSILEVQFAKGDRKSPGQMRGKDPQSQRDRYRSDRRRRSRSRSYEGRRDSRRDRDDDRRRDDRRDDRRGGRRRSRTKSPAAANARSASPGEGDE